MPTATKYEQSGRWRKVLMGNCINYCSQGGITAIKGTLSIESEKGRVMTRERNGRIR